MTSVYNEYVYESGRYPLLSGWHKVIYEPCDYHPAILSGNIMIGDKYWQYFREVTSVPTEIQVFYNGEVARALNGYISGKIIKIYWNCNPPDDHFLCISYVSRVGSSENIIQSAVKTCNWLQEGF